MNGRAIVLTALALMTLTCGCSSPEQRYAVLSIFFDGVPDPSKKPAAAEVEGKGQAKKEARELTTHGPFAARLCGGCHERASNKILFPLDRLCVNCHVFKLDKRWIHGPLASGGCRVCHEPHSSPYRYLLVAESKEFCFYCHRREDVMKTQTHQKSDLACTACHDAHASDQEFLLR